MKYVTIYKNRTDTILFKDDLVFNYGIFSYLLINIPTYE